MPFTRILDWEIHQPRVKVWEVTIVQLSDHREYNQDHACIPILGKHRTTKHLVRLAGLYTKECLTNLDLEAFGKRVRYSLKLPYSISAEMVESGEMDVSTPRRGNTFGWFKFFQVITSL